MDTKEQIASDKDVEIEHLQKKLRSLAESVIRVVPYVKATLSGKGLVLPPEWYEIHRGRAFSSKNQLGNLEREAQATLILLR